MGRSFWSGVGLLGLLGFAALPGFVWMSLGDPPIDDADLHVARSALEPDLNGVARLDVAARAVGWSEEQANALARLLTGSAWDEALAAEGLARSAVALERVPEILAAPAFQLAPLAWDADAFAFSAGESPEWLSLARALALRARNHARARRAEEAFADARAAVEIGARVRGARGADLTTTMFGLSFSGIGLGALERALADLEPDAAQARRWTDALAQARPEPEAWSAMWAGEYEHTALLMDRIASGEGGPEAGAAPDPWRNNRYFFKPNATRALFAERYRGLRRDAGRPCSELRPLPSELPRSGWPKLRALLGPNSVGRILFEVAAPDVVFEHQRCGAETRLDATRVWIALRAHELEHGALPEKLDALVPRYLAEVPRDAFDGAVLHYDRAARSLGRERPGVDPDRVRTLFPAPFPP